MWPQCGTADHAAPVFQCATFAYAMVNSAVVVAGTSQGEAARGGAHGDGGGDDVDIFGGWRSIADGIMRDVTHAARNITTHRRGGDELALNFTDAVSDIVGSVLDDPRRGSRHVPAQRTANESHNGTASSGVAVPQAAPEVRGRPPAAPGNRPGSGEGRRPRTNPLGGLAKDIGKAVRRGVSSGVHGAEKALERVEQVKRDGVINIGKPNKLLGHTRGFNNGVLLAILGFVGLATAAGGVIDALCLLHCRKGTVDAADARPPSWVLGMLCSSYALLGPGLTCTLFSFNIFIDAKVRFVGSFGVNLMEEPMTESMVTLVGLLFTTGGELGGLFVVLYAMVVPGIKLMLLLLGEFWRGSDNAGRRRISASCIAFVQSISKWASPDLFAYILLLFLFRHMDHPPLIQSQAALDVGFECFGIFCLFSTFSTLAIHQPEGACAEAPAAEAPYQSVDGGPGAAQRQLVSAGHEAGNWNDLAVAVVSVVLAVTFTLLFLLGICMPCMGLRMGTDAVVQPKGPVPKNLAFILERPPLEIPQKLQTDVSIMGCIGALAAWSADGELASLLALVMLTVFVVILSLLDMVVLVAAACMLGVQHQKTAMSASRVLKHVSMLDVFCMGVIVVCLAGRAYESMGIYLCLMRGMIPLVSAEAVHYVAFYLVSSAVDRGTHDHDWGNDDRADGEMGCPCSQLVDAGDGTDDDGETTFGTIGTSRASWVSMSRASRSSSRKSNRELAAVRR